jgi:5-methylcytosine-specific restriction endonuclease McrA
MVAKGLDKTVRDRAKNRCEYCLMPQSAKRLRFWLDHVVAVQHKGPTEAANLALACPRCNRNKGTNLSAIDSETLQTVLH